MDRVSDNPLPESPMPDSVPVIAPLGPGDLPGALALSQAEGWPHRTEDWAMIAGLGHGLVARAGDRVVGTACLVPFGAVAMLNMIIVSEAMRGRGLGARLMRAAMALVPAREYRLVATEAGMPLYRKLGFRETGRIAQSQGMLAATDALLPDLAGPDEAGAIAALDRAATGTDRRPLIQALLAAGPVALLRDGDRITGYGARRPFGRGLLIGPVIAPDAEGARRLIAGLCAGCAGRFMRLDTPVEAGLTGWLAGLGLAHVDGGTTMSHGPRPPAPATPACFALAAQALG